MRRNSYVAVAKLPGQQTPYEEIDRLRPSDVATGVLSMVIPYTTPELTRAALRHAGVCSDLDANVRLVDIQVVPFPCPLNEPPINKEFSEHRLRELLKESGLPGQATVLYTRDWLEAFKKVLDPGSLVILATKKRWWPTHEEKTRSYFNEGRTSSDATAGCEVNYVGSVLPGGCDCFFRPDVGLYQSGGKTVGRTKWNMQSPELRRSFSSFI